MFCLVPKKERASGSIIGDKGYPHDFWHAIGVSKATNKCFFFLSKTKHQSKERKRGAYSHYVSLGYYCSNFFPKHNYRLDI